MRALSAAEILDVWERGADQRPAERALTVLAAVCPGRPYDSLGALSVGQRDALLLAAREQTFGAELTGTARCPGCAEWLEFSTSASDLQAEPNVNVELDTAPRSFRATLAPTGPTGPAAHLIYRLPTGGDLVALDSMADAEAFRRALAVRCILEATWGGAALPASELPAELLAALADEMSACDPQAEVLLDLACPACGNRWQALFDIEAFFWAELAAEAKRLVREVDTLARAYGWREADILRLNPRRRRAYLEMVLG